MRPINTLPVLAVVNNVVMTPQPTLDAIDILCTARATALDPAWEILNRAVYRLEEELRLYLVGHR